MPCIPTCVSQWNRIITNIALYKKKEKYKFQLKWEYRDKNSWQWLLCALFVFSYGTDIDLIGPSLSKTHVFK